METGQFGIRRDPDGNHDADMGASAASACLGPTGLAALGAARHSRILVAPAAEALDKLRAELARADGLIAEQQARLGELYGLFASWEGDSG